jgi:hypothetical protein
MLEATTSIRLPESLCKRSSPPYPREYMGVGPKEEEVHYENDPANVAPRKWRIPPKSTGGSGARGQGALEEAFE